jgi:hypothetical protein
MATDNPNTIITTITKQLTHDLDVNVGNKCICFDTSNQRIGINTIDPQYELDIRQNGSVYIDGSINIIGNISCGNITTSGTINSGGAFTTINCTDDVNVGGDISCNGHIDVDNDINCGGSVNIIGDISCNNKITTNEFEVIQTLQSNTRLLVNNSENIILDVSNGNINLNANTKISGATFIGDISMSGSNINMSNGNILNVADISGNNGNLNIYGNISVQTGINMNTKNITNLADPQNSRDAVNKEYIDQWAHGLTHYNYVQFATTVGDNILNFANVTQQLTIDSCSNILVGYDILIKDQTDHTQNGVYTRISSTELYRRSDMLSGDISSGAYFFVEYGESNEGTGWALQRYNGSSNLSINDDSLNFTKVSSSQAYRGSANITIDGATISFNPGTDDNEYMKRSDLALSESSTATTAGNLYLPLTGTAVLATNATYATTASGDADTIQNTYLPIQNPSTTDLSVNNISAKTGSAITIDSSIDMNSNDISNVDNIAMKSYGGSITNINKISGWVDISINSNIHMGGSTPDNRKIDMNGGSIIDCSLINITSITNTTNATLYIGNNSIGITIDNDYLYIKGLLSATDILNGYQWCGKSIKDGSWPTQVGYNNGLWELGEEGDYWMPNSHWSPIMYNINTQILCYHYAASDRKLKTNIEPFRRKLDIVNKLNPVYFNWIKSGAPDHGFIAQELETLIPGLIRDDIDASGEITKVYEYEAPLHFIPVLTKAIQDLDEDKNKEVAELNTRIIALEAENATLKTQMTDVLSRLSLLENLI